jgi:hypothetical protein
MSNNWGIPRVLPPLLTGFNRDLDAMLYTLLHRRDNGQPIRIEHFLDRQ